MEYRCTVAQKRHDWGHDGWRTPRLCPWTAALGPGPLAPCRLASPAQHPASTHLWLLGVQPLRQLLVGVALYRQRRAHAEHLEEEGQVAAKARQRGAQHLRPVAQQRQQRLPRVAVVGQQGVSRGVRAHPAQRGRRMGGGLAGWAGRMHAGGCGSTAAVRGQVQRRLERGAPAPGPCSRPWALLPPHHSSAYGLVGSTGWPEAATSCATCMVEGASAVRR